jgi:hypothetical protein
MTNHHLSPEQRKQVRELLLQGQHATSDIAAMAGTSPAAVRYQRDLLVMEGTLKRPFLPAARNYATEARKPSTVSKRVYNAPQYGAPMCIVAGCDQRRLQGAHCDEHQPERMIARATAGMSELTKRKLMRGRA